jgi:predicted nucleic acid-binding protein
MILLDTTVLVKYLRTRSAAIRAVLENGNVAICGVTRAEILHGAKSRLDAISLIAAMDGFVQISINQSDWDELGNNLALLRLSGITVPFPDALIATLALREKCDLWTFDGHFKAIGGVLPNLQLFSGPGD